MADTDVLLKMEGISKSFPGVKALDNVELTLQAGTVHALMGENGAGKSTLMKCLWHLFKGFWPYLSGGRGGQFSFIPGGS